MKAQYDFIRSKIHDATVFVHEHCGESGAIGAALEAMRVMRTRCYSSHGQVRYRSSRFVGLSALQNLELRFTRDESTRCGFCRNRCMRTFVDARLSDDETRRYIVATCERGTVESVSDMKTVSDELSKVKA